MTVQQPVHLQSPAAAVAVDDDFARKHLLLDHVLRDLIPRRLPAPEIIVQRNHVNLLPFQYLDALLD